MDLPVEYLGSQCEVKTLQNDLLAVGVLKKAEDEKLYIGAAKGEVMPTLPYRQKVKLVAFNSELGSTIVTGNVYLSNPEFVCVNDVEMLVDYEKRNFFRVNVSMHTAIDFHDAETGKFITVPADIKDLSLSGISFSCNAAFQVGDHLEILLCLLEARRMYYKCIIRRIMEHPKEEGISVYGCSFERMTNEMSTALCAFLFQQQRLQIHKSKRNVSWSSKD